MIVPTESQLPGEGFSDAGLIDGLVSWRAGDKSEVENRNTLICGCIQLL